MSCLCIQRTDDYETTLNGLSLELQLETIFRAMPIKLPQKHDEEFPQDVERDVQLDDCCL